LYKKPRIARLFLLAGALTYAVDVGLAIGWYAVALRSPQHFTQTFHDRMMGIMH
jgi:hypothetical protein